MHISKNINFGDIDTSVMATVVFTLDTAAIFSLEARKSTIWKFCVINSISIQNFTKIVLLIVLEGLDILPFKITYL